MSAVTALQSEGSPKPPQEIERRFIVNEKLATAPHLFWRSRGTLIKQGYLSVQPPVTRVRIASSPKGVLNTAWLTVKGAGMLKRPEHEFRIPVDSAQQLLDLSLRSLEKIRWTIGYAGKVWTVDRFMSPHIEGLWLAEIELQEESEMFALPDWVDAEVTEDKRYSNVNLANSVDLTLRPDPWVQIPWGSSS